MLPAELRNLEAKIRNADPTEQAIPYPEDTWRRHLGDDVDFDYLARAYPSPMSRNSLFRLAAVAKSSPNLHNVRRLFVGAMLFGYGNVGYGPWRTMNMLCTRDADVMLQKSFALVLENRIADAYQCLQLTWCKRSFVSKFLYFAGFGAGLSGYPLILDNNVETALHTHIGIDVSEFDGSGRVGATKYARYVATMHVWARELRCEAHNIEYYLWGLA